MSKTSTTRTPKIKVSHIKPPKPRRRRAPWYAAFITLAVLLVITGSVFAFKRRQAARSVRVVEEPVVKVLSESSYTPEEKWAIPLEFNQEDLQIIADLLPVLLMENRKVPSIAEVKNERRKERLRNFLAGYNSPFAESDKTLQAFLDAKNMRLMIAISFVESTLGKRCYYHNCSGIGGYPPNLRKYEDFSEWVRDFDSLLERRYKGVPIEKFIGLYVQPGSPSWINGVKRMLAEMKSAGVE